MELITWENFSPAEQVEKKPRLHENISARAETEIESEPRQEFVGSLCCFGNLHPATPVNHLFSPGLKFHRVITWDFSAWSTGLKFSARVGQTGLKLSSCNREFCFSSIL